MHRFLVAHLTGSSYPLRPKTRQRLT